MQPPAGSARRSLAAEATAAAALEATAMPTGGVALMEAGHLAIAFKLLGLHMLLLFLLLRLQLKPHDPPLIMQVVGDGCSSLTSSPTACSGLQPQLKHSYNAGTLLRGPEEMGTCRLRSLTLGR